MGVPRDSTKWFNIPRCSSICSDLPRRLIFHSIPRYSSITNDILVYATSFQDRPWRHDTPRYSTIFLMFFSEASLFLVLGANAPFRRYRDIPKVVFERLRANSAMHDITTYTIPWYSCILSELPRQTATSSFPMVSHNTSQYSMIIQYNQYNQWASKAAHDIMAFHRLPLNCSTIHDIPYAVTFPTDWYSTRLHGIPRYPIIL